MRAATTTGRLYDNHLIRLAGSSNPMPEEFVSTALFLGCMDGIPSGFDSRRLVNRPSWRLRGFFNLLSIAIVATTTLILIGSL